MEYYCDTKRHLICVPYSVDNLHEMAKYLNIGGHWYHGGKFPHYDIPMKRKNEIEDVANVITTRELLEIIRG